MTGADLVAGVERANEEFYRAFEACDMNRMASVWARGPHVRCIHPGWDLLVGWSMIERSWQRVLANVEPMTIELEQLQVRAGREVGWVTCVERITRRTLTDVLVDRALATNVFEREQDGVWRIVEHHASPILARRRPRPTPPRNALN